MKKFVWDTSAILNIKEPDAQGYSPGSSLFKDLTDGWISGPYLNIFPAIAVFEVEATVSRWHREGKSALREFYLVNEHAVIFSVEKDLINRSASLFTQSGFASLRGADLIFACIAYLEDAYLVTLDTHFDAVSGVVKVLNLNASRESPKYRDNFRK